MRFSYFMKEWLYGKDGYYSYFKEIGKEGDFYTAVSATPFFGGAIAKRFLSIVDEGYLSENTTILEIGAHKGYLLADIIQFIYTLEPKLLKTLKFAIFEPRIQILNEQKRYMQNSFGDKVKIYYFDDFKDIKLDSAFVVANEIFDAFVCEVVKDGKMLYMDGFTPVFKPLSKDIQKITKRYKINKGEIALGYDDFAKMLSSSLYRFEFVTFDYGDKGQRGDFSLRIYDKHRVYPFFSLTDFAKDKSLEKEGISLQTLYKKSDITYDVNFSYLRDEFAKNGIEEIAYYTQLKAMIEFGIVELFKLLKDNVDQKIYLQELNKAKVLLEPSFMGERFKCAIFRKC